MHYGRRNIAFPVIQFQRLKAHMKNICCAVFILQLSNSFVCHFDKISYDRQLTQSQSSKAQKQQDYNLVIYVCIDSYCLCPTRTWRMDSTMRSQGNLCMWLNAGDSSLISCNLREEMGLFLHTKYLNVALRKANLWNQFYVAPSFKWKWGWQLNRGWWSAVSNLSDSFRWENLHLTHWLTQIFIEIHTHGQTDRVMQ